MTDFSHTSQDRFRDLYELAPLAYFTVSPDGCIKMVNAKACELLGYSRDELVAKHVMDLYAKTEFDQPKARRIQEQILGGKEIVDEELHMQKSDGTLIWVNVTVRLLYDDQGNLLERLGVVQDITQKKHAQEEFRHREDRFRSLIETVGSVMVGLDCQGLITEWNHEAETIYGRNREEVLGQNYFALFLREEDRQAVADDMENVLKGVPTRGYENPIKCADGQERVMSWNVDRLVDRDQNPIGLIAIGQDITHRTQVEKALLESEERFRKIFEEGPLGMALVGQDFRFLKVNLTLCRMVGYTEDELMGLTFADITHPEDLHQDCYLAKEVFEGRIPYYRMEKRYLKKNGEIFWIHLTASVIRSQSGRLLYGLAMIEDITERKQAEESLTHAKQAYQELMDSIEGIVWEAEFPSYRFTFVNQQAERLFGYPVECWLRDREFFSHRLHPEDRERVLSYCYEETKQKRDHELEYRMIDSHGEVVWVRGLVTVVLENGQPVKVRGVMVNITDRKTLEDEIRQYSEGLELEVNQRAHRIQELEQQRMQVEKLAALAQVAAGIAHEINNPLASIGQSLELVRRAIPPSHPRYPYVGKIQDSIDRISGIVRQLYLLYGPEHRPLKPIDLMETACTALEIMKEQVHKAGITLVSHLPRRGPMAKVSRSDLIQVLCNLIQNAIEASPQEKPVTLAFQRKAETCMFSVSDRGEGIPPDIAPHVFEPFFTTKHDSRTEGGMGLGLAVSYRLVESMGGRLGFTTEIGQGTVFTVTLPRIHEEESTMCYGEAD